MKMKLGTYKCLCFLVAVFIASISHASPKGSYVKSNSKYKEQVAQNKKAIQAKKNTKNSNKKIVKKQRSKKTQIAKNSSTRKTSLALKKPAKGTKQYARKKTNRKLARLSASASSFALANNRQNENRAYGDQAKFDEGESKVSVDYTEDTSLMQLEEAQKEINREGSTQRIINAVAQDDFKLEKTSSGGFSINHVGPFVNTDGKRYYEVLPSGERVALTIDPSLQYEAEALLRKYDLPNAAIVAIEPSTGKIKAISGYSSGSSNGQSLVSRSSFPAASLFKMITASAAVEKVGLDSNTPVNYRGGTYSLGKHNYLPSAKADKQKMTLSQAMGKSCNPVFARVALNYLSSDVIKSYANNFGFGKPLAYDFPVNVSTFQLTRDEYTLARTAAGFGDVYISPVHAAAMVAALGNNGLMMRPYIVDSVVIGPGKYQILNNIAPQQRVVSAETSYEILQMMESTITDGTARRHFKLASPQLRSIPIAAKTGTLSGKNPKGVYHWFTAVAPVDKPVIAVAALVIDSGRARINGVGIGRQFLEKVFDKGSLTDRARNSLKEKEEPFS